MHIRRKDFPRSDYFVFAHKARFIAFENVRDDDCESIARFSVPAGLPAEF